MLIKIQEICEKIDIEKEILNAMPKNNEKNIQKYKEKIEQLKAEYKGIYNKIENELNSRYKKTIDIEPMDEKIKIIDKKINTIENELSLLNNVKTSYEKINLDRIIYKIGRYYKDNLDNINEQIGQIIRKFSEVGINLELSDFDYSIYVEQYMKVFFEEYKKNDINSNNLKAKFEEIYWKCPDIIIHIELNIRSIYYKKEAQIDKFFDKEKNLILKQSQMTKEEIKSLYFELKEQKRKIISEDKKRLLNEFLFNNLDIKNYEEEKIQSDYSKILSPTMINGIEINQEEMEKGILELLNSLYEYKNYMNFKFIIDDLKNNYEDKEKNKKIYEETLKKIAENEKKLKKANKKTLSKGIFGKKKKEVKQTAEQNQIIEELKKEYKELDKNKFLNKIATELSPNSTIHEALNLANSYYNYLANCIIENNKNITQEKIDEQIKKLNEFINTPYNNIINNLTILEEKDIVMIIKDRYKLLNFNIKQEDFNPKNIENLTKTLENILISFRMKRVGLKVKEIKETIEIKQILKM